MSQSEMCDCGDECQGFPNAVRPNTACQRSVTSKRQTIAESWTEFQRLTIPIGAPPRQQIEMRRAYYCGISWVFDVLGTQFDHSRPEPTDADVAHMEAIYEEIKQFADAIQRGVA